jgi:RNA polymerase sigma-70 factor (ECF subfamily)
MVNTAINYLKSQDRYQYDLSFVEKNLHPVSDENPELLLNAKELADLIRQLPIGYQTIFNMHAVEGYKHSEIGKILGIHEGTSKSQYARARSLLITGLQEILLLINGHLCTKIILKSRFRKNGSAWI